MIDYLKKIWNALTSLGSNNKQQTTELIELLTQLTLTTAASVQTQSQILAELKAIHMLLATPPPVKGVIYFGTPINK